MEYFYLYQSPMQGPQTNTNKIHHAIVCSEERITFVMSMLKLKSAREIVELNKTTSIQQ